MTVYQVKLRWVAFAFVVIFLLYGVALALAGVAILLGDHLVGGIGTMVAGGALAFYGVKVARDARRGHYAPWLRDIPHLPEIG